MLSKQEEQADRLDILRNEQKLRDQGSTFLDHTHNEVGGRYAAISSPVVVGENQIPNYPAGPAWCAADQGLEPPTGYSIEAQEPVGPLQAQPPTPDAPQSPLAGDVARRGRTSSRTFRRT